jgi:hypothetical protein
VGTFPAPAAGDPVELTLGGARLAGDLRQRAVADRPYRPPHRRRDLPHAADATTSKAEIRGADAPAGATWVAVTGTWHPEGGLGTDEAWPPVLDATAVREIVAPAGPYEKR